MKLIVFITMFIGLAVCSPTLLAQVHALPSDTQHLITSIEDNTNLSHEQKVIEYNALLAIESSKSDVDELAILKLNAALVFEFMSNWNHAKAKALFETQNFSVDSETADDYTSAYIKLLKNGAFAYLGLLEFDNAQKIITQLQSYLSFNGVTNCSKADIFKVTGQFYAMTKHYKDGLAMFQSAMKAYNESDCLSEIDRKDQVGLMHFNIGNIYYLLGDYINAIDNYEKYPIESGNPLSPQVNVSVNRNIALSHLNLTQWNEAIHKASLMKEQASNLESEKPVADFNRIIARAEHGLGNSAKAIPFIRVSIDIYKNLNFTRDLSGALADEASFHINLGDWAEAEKKITEAHAVISGSEHEIPPILELLRSSFLVEQNNGNFEKALFYHTQLMSVKQTDFETKKKQDTQRLMLDFDQDLAQEKALRLSAELELAKEKAISLQQENQVNAVVLEKNQSQNRLLITLVSATILALLMLAFVFLRERKLKMKMSSLAMTDYLTGYPNRRNAMTQAEALLIEQVNRQDSMVFAILDVDNFKTVNDTYGHDVGDKVLQNVTSFISGALRDTDVIGRYGGEEFIVLLPNAGENEINMIFARIQLALKNHCFEYNGETITLPITVSMGASVVSNVPKQLNEDENRLLLDSIIKQADKKAYEAKHAGKNQLKSISMSLST